MNYNIRWMIRRDMPEVLKIERDSFELPWTTNDFILTIKNRNTIGMVVEYHGKIIGFMIYELHKKFIKILNFAVALNSRNQYVGKAMMEKLIYKLCYKRRNMISVEVRESNLVAQLFFKSMGLKAVTTIHNAYEDNDEDAYLMEYIIKKNEVCVPLYTKKGRGYDVGY